MDISTAFNQAVNRPENIQKNGHVNWNYIDADVYMDVQPNDSEAHYEKFEQLADQFESLHGKQIQDDNFYMSEAEEEAYVTQRFVEKGVFSEYAEEGLNTI